VLAVVDDQEDLSRCQKLADRRLRFTLSSRNGPNVTGLMGLPAGEDSAKKIKAVKPAAEIVAEMMAEALEILRAELAATSEGD
jgi:hypothetical protein